MKKIQFIVDSGDKRRNRKIMLEILSIKKKIARLKKKYIFMNATDICIQVSAFGRY